MAFRAPVPRVLAFRNEMCGHLPRHLWDTEDTVCSACVYYSRHNLTRWLPTSSVDFDLLQICFRLPLVSLCFALHLFHLKDEFITSSFHFNVLIWMSENKMMKTLRHLKAKTQKNRQTLRHITASVKKQEMTNMLPSNALQLYWESLRFELDEALSN